MAERIHLTIGELLEKTANQIPDHEAVVYPDRGLNITYRQFDQLCRRTAKGLMKLGIKKGEHVAIWASNTPEWLLTQFAAAKIGAVLVTINTNHQSSELEYVLKHSVSTTLILMESYKTTSFTKILDDVVPELKNSAAGDLQSSTLPLLKNIIMIGKNKHPGMYLWDDLAKLADDISEQELEERMESLDQHDVINIQYTSGTTGFPKGVMLTHYNLVNNAINIAECLNLTTMDRMCIPVPFFHCFGCVLGNLVCVTVGGTMVPVQEFNPKTVLQTVEMEKCTVLHGVPTMFITELSEKDFELFDLSSLRTGIMAGSICPVEVMKEVIDKMGMSEITIAYGQTEASPVITQTRFDDSFRRKVETVGRALPNIEVKITQPGTNQEVKRGTQGELCTRGYHVMKGYYKDLQATAQVIDEDGFLHTGDLAVMDEDGYCKITGRLKDMIIRGGENIYPREIEEFLYQHPKILDVQVVGVPDQTLGEEVSAWVKVKSGESLTTQELLDYCKGKIARYKIPRHIAFVNDFPMTASGKIQKFKLREQAIKYFQL
ncbi:AMP-binding protein [Bacillus changyiensis]|uniref:AMP-binding protein n=1 Tax=Bacillus changyiensis TaxID=3004103 RepID=UPI0022DFE52B|nr:AMP-binding protein [Bacillus changyiensis]MDA1475133.1 AMP-binding protein [Bacillus changyiensis]